MNTVLFVCTHNSSRSQMAEGLLRDRYGDQYEVCSAGTEPGGVNPFAVQVMDEIGIDISDHTSDSVDAYADTTHDIVATVCDDAAENCPYIPARTENLHRGFDDPSAFQRHVGVRHYEIRTDNPRISVAFEVEFRISQS